MVDMLIREVIEMIIKLKTGEHDTDSIDHLLRKCRAALDYLKRVKDQVDDVLVVNWISVKDSDYRKALADLVAWEIQIHDDPAVSEEAAKRKEEKDKIIGLLSELQWSSSGQHATSGYCKFCNYFRNEGHNEGCQLGKLLKENNI